MLLHIVAAQAFFVALSSAWILNIYDTEGCSGGEFFVSGTEGVTCYEKIPGAGNGESVHNSASASIIDSEFTITVYSDQFCSDDATAIEVNQCTNLKVKSFSVDPVGGDRRKRRGLNNII